MDTWQIIQRELDTINKSYPLLTEVEQKVLIETINISLERVCLIENLKKLQE
jgi:hypothetical protein